MPPALLACPSLTGPLPNTGDGGPQMVLVMLLLAVVALVIAKRRGRPAALAAAVLVATLVGTGPTGATAADCSPAAGAPGPAYSATVFKGGGAEPNVSISPSGRNVLVSGLGGGKSPASLFRSTDFGQHFSAISPAFANKGGGDWDMRWVDDTHVIAADLSLRNGIYVHRSSDSGDHWTDTVIHTDVYDRPWIDHDGAGHVYLVSKGFNGVPYMYVSSDGGASFGSPPIGLLLYGLPNSGGPDTPASFITGQNTYVDHLLVDHDGGDVFILYGANPGSTYSVNQPEGAPNQLYVGHLENGAIVSHPVHLGAADESCLGGFNWLTEDQQGTLYVLGNCRIGGRWSTWLSFSRDRAHHWSPLVDLGEPGASNVYASIAGGAAGRLSLAYLRGSIADPSQAQNWFARVATVVGADTASPGVVRSSPVAPAIHTQDICFDGILCGTVPPFGNNRSMLDYIWNAVGPDGTAYGVFASDGPATGSADGKTPDVMLLRQSSGAGIGKGAPS